ncbi:MAG: T9SS type A sorting domain-containing protein [Gelidibacter sp.]
MRQLLLALLLCTSFVGFGQCPTTPIVLSSQADVDNFATNYPNCTEILNGLQISGEDIDDLTPLSNIAAVGYQINVSNNPLLESLNGLNGITTFHPSNLGVIDIQIDNNTILTDISALGNLVPSQSIESLFVRNNPMLLSLDGLQGIQPWVIYYVFIENNDSLNNLNGLNNIISCESMRIVGNDNLTSMSGLDSFDWIGTLTLENNDSLISLNGMPNVSLECGLEINENQLLENIDVFNVVEDFCTSALEITNNPNLSICDNVYVCSYLDYHFGYNYILIENNAEGCNSATQVATDGCALIPNNDDCAGNFFINIGGPPIEAYNVLATASSYTPSCNDTPNRADVWFKFYSGFNTSVDILIETGYNMQLWQGDNCSSLIQVPGACALGSLEDVVVTPNAYYYVQVWSCESCRLQPGVFSIQIQDGTLSTPEISQDLDLTLFPNPVNNLLTLNAQSVIDNVIVYSMHGQQILDFQPKALEATLDLQDLASGMYLVKVKSNGTEQIFKIIKN